MAFPTGKVDPNLLNPWGVTEIPTGSPFWISDNGAGVSTLYNVPTSAPNTVIPPVPVRVVSIPTPVDLLGRSGAPTGPELSDNLIVQLGLVTEPLHRHWFAASVRRPYAPSCKVHVRFGLLSLLRRVRRIALGALCAKGLWCRNASARQANAATCRQCVPYANIVMFDTLALSERTECRMADRFEW